MELSETIKKFLEEITSQRTKDSYTKKITSFYDYLTKQNKISNETYKNYFAGIGIDVIEQALDYYIRNQNIESESAAYDYKSVIRMYFDYIQHLGIVADDIVVILQAKAGEKHFEVEKRVKLINPRIIEEGYKIGTRGFTNYILHADDMIEA